MDVAELQMETYVFTRRAPDDPQRQSSESRSSLKPSPPRRRPIRSPPLQEGAALAPDQLYQRCRGSLVAAAGRCNGPHVCSGRSVRSPGRATASEHSPRVSRGSGTGRARNGGQVGLSTQQYRSIPTLTV